MIDIAPRDILAVVVSVAAATTLALVLYHRTSPTLPLRLRVILGVIRWFAAIIILMLVSDPIVGIVRTEHRDPVIAVLVDDSRSMGYPSTENKIEVVRRMLSPDFIRRLESKADLRFYAFSERAVEITRDQLASLRPEGSRTDLAQSIRTVLDGFSTAPSAFIVFTDGAFNFGEDVVNLVSTLRSPVHTVAATRSESAPDISLDRIGVTETAYANTDVPVTLLLSARGTGPVDVTVVIRDSTGTVFSRRVSMAGTGAKTVVDATLDAGAVGVHDFTVELSGIEDDAVVSNNSGVFSLDVVKGKIRVVLIASGLSWDFAFARRSLEADPNVEVFSLFTGGSAVKPRIPGTVPNLSSVSDLDAAVVLGRRLGADTAADLRDAVREGKGLVLLAGPDPTGLDSALSPFETDGGRGGIALMVSATVTAVGADHEVLRLSQAAGGFSWAELPPVPVSERISGAADDATVLLSGTGEKGGVPVLAIRRYGRGRIVGLAAYDLWRWDLIPKGFGLEASPFSQILLNSISWLTEGDEVQRLSLSSSKRTYLWGEPVDLFARVVDDDLKPVDDVILECEVSKQPEGEALSRFTMTEKGSGSHLGRIDRLAPGRYRAHATAELGDSLYGHQTVDFNVDARGLEDYGYDGDLALLQQVARLTGGTLYDPADAGRLAEETNPGVVITKKREEIRLPLTLPVFLVLAGLFGVEWWLRKQKMLL